MRILRPSPRISDLLLQEGSVGKVVGCTDLQYLLLHVTLEICLFLPDVSLSLKFHTELTVSNCYKDEDVDKIACIIIPCRLYRR